MNSVSNDQNMDKQKITKLRVCKRDGKLTLETSCYEEPAPWLRGCISDCETHIELKDTLEDVDWNSLLSKYQNIPNNLLDVGFSKITITGSFIQKLFEEKRLSEIHTLQVTNCDFEDDGLTEYLKLLSERKLNTLTMRYNRANSCVMPVQILNNVSTTFDYMPCNYDILGDLGHFTDEILAEWMCPPKTLHLGKCTTGFTLPGIEQQLKKLYAENAPMESFAYNLGYSKNVTAQEIRNFLNSFKELKWEDGIHYEFKITRFYDVQCNIMMHTQNK